MEGTFPLACPLVQYLLLCLSKWQMKVYFSITKQEKEKGVGMAPNLPCLCSSLLISHPTSYQ